MDELSKVLESFQATLKEKLWDKDSSPTQPLGSINDVGNQIIPTIGRTSMGSQSSLHQNSEPSPHTPKSSQKETPKLIRDCLESQNQLSMLLAQCHLLLKGYGEKAEDAKARDAGFQWLLGRFTIMQVREAFTKYIERNSGLPVPADIINIIEPLPPKLSGAVYLSYQKKACSGGWLLSDERQYCRDYEAQEMENGRASREFVECQKQIEASRSRTYDIGYEGYGYEGEIE